MSQRYLQSIIFVDQLINLLFMAIAISNIPVLKGKEAEDFIKKAEDAELERGTIDFSEQRLAMKKILERAEL